MTSKVAACTSQCNCLSCKAVAYQSPFFIQLKVGSSKLARGEECF